MEEVILHFFGFRRDWIVVDFHRLLGVAKVTMALKGSEGCGRLCLGRYDN
jgi:hypothetical protein